MPILNPQPIQVQTTLTPVTPPQQQQQLPPQPQQQPPSPTTTPRDTKEPKQTAYVFPWVE